MIAIYSERMATIGRTDAARRAGARLARTATSIAIAAATTYVSVSTLLSGTACFRIELGAERCWSG